MTGAVSADLLMCFSRSSTGTRDQSYKKVSMCLVGLPKFKTGAHLVNVDLRLPLLVPQEVETSHTNLTEVTRVVLVEVGSVVVLTTGHTTTTGVL